MTTGTNRILDDFAKLMTDAAGAAQGVRKEMETIFHAQAERFLNGMDLVKRDEFEAVREMAVKARDENEALLKRIEALEERLAADEQIIRPGSFASLRAEAGAICFAPASCFRRIFSPLWTSLKKPYRRVG